MHIHILGICGTFMGGIALIARELGYEVSGSDANVYPPMSTMLEKNGIKLSHGYDPAHLKPDPDLVVIGNALSRGNPAVEYVLNQGLSYTSGPAFLSDYVLRGRWVLGVAGTHGKTSTSSMLAWILEYAGLKPGFLIGGVMQNFDVSARLGEIPFFVVEADEYDSAFFDKRSKFIHYHSRTLILNNLEYDHADIFPDLDAIKRQFHHLVRTVPGNGLIISPSSDKNMEEVIKEGCWTAREYFSDKETGLFSNEWHAREISEAGGRFDVYFGDDKLGQVNWELMGRHNVCNALAAIAAARHAGVMPEHAIAALMSFQGVKRRMEKRATINGINIYDDFAHHPTAIATTLQGMRERIGSNRMIAVLEPRSNTMRLGVHSKTLPDSLKEADEIFLYQPEGLEWSLGDIAQATGSHARVIGNVDAIVTQLVAMAKAGDHIIIMSNGAFDGIHNKLIEELQKQ